MAPKQQQPHQEHQPGHARPYRTIITSFAAWKLLLFAITLGSFLVGEAYDTSAGLVVQPPDSSSSSSSKDGVSRLIARLSSWDAIYFVSIARRGCRFEQDWAFCGGLPVAVRGLLRGEFLLG
jgi:phosphatidylinositol glycan class V